MSQLSLHLRYSHNNLIREDFVQFIDAYKNIVDIKPDQTADTEQWLTGEALGKIVVKLLQDLSLDLNNCVGIGSDSGSVMSSEAVGAVTEVQKVLKSACRCPFLNHVLNISLSTSANGKRRGPYKVCCVLFQQVSQKKPVFERSSMATTIKPV